VRGWWKQRGDLFREGSNLAEGLDNEKLVKEAETKVKNIGESSGFDDFVGTLSKTRGTRDYFGKKGMAKRIEANLSALPKDD
jgi:hypothetical protein